MWGLRDAVRWRYPLIVARRLRLALATRIVREVPVNAPLDPDILQVAGVIGLPLPEPDVPRISLASYRAALLAFSPRMLPRQPKEGCGDIVFQTHFFVLASTSRPCWRSASGSVQPRSLRYPWPAKGWCRFHSRGAWRRPTTRFFCALQQGHRDITAPSSALRRGGPPHARKRSSQGPMALHLLA